MISGLTIKLMAQAPLTHKVVFMGNSAVGKTSIINQYIYNSSSAEHTPTIGIDFFAKTLQVDGQSLRLQIWDTAGQEKFHSVIPSYIRNSTVAVFVYDITSKESFEYLDRWYKMVDDIANPRLVVVGNKIDLAEERAVPTEDGKKFADAHNALFIEVSACAPTNIDQLFDMISKIPTGNDVIQTQSKQDTTTTVNVEDSQNKASGGGCC